MCCVPYVSSCEVILCHVMSCYVIWCHMMSCDVMWCHVMSCDACVLQLMSSIKTVLIEMLSQFEAKGKMGAKVIREQLHSAWPVPGSRSVQDTLSRELLQQLTHELEVVSEGGRGGGMCEGVSGDGECVLPGRCVRRRSWSVSRWSVRCEGRSGSRQSWRRSWLWLRPRRRSG